MGHVCAAGFVDASRCLHLTHVSPNAQEWRRAREHEIKQQKAVQLTYDWTFTTPYTCTVVQPTVGSSRPAAPPRSAPDYVMGPAPGLTASHSAPLPAGTVTPGHNPSTMAHAYSAAPSSTTTITTMPPPAAIATLPMAQGSGQKGQSVTSADGGDSQGGSGLSWQPTADVIDRGLLMERDPILFYEEVSSPPRGARTWTAPCRHA